MIRRLLFCITILSALVPMHLLWASSVALLIVTLTQPDGFTFEGRSRGDEYGSWTETLDGLTIVRDGDEWFYADQDVSGKLFSSGYSVGTLTQDEYDLWPRSLAPYVDPDTREKHYPIRYRPRGEWAKGLTHTQKVLTILVDFSYSGTEIGTEDLPFDTLAEAVAEVNAAGTIWMDAGATSDIITIDQHVTLKSTGGTVTIGSP